MKVLFLATYFPRPLNPNIGPWALEHAQALSQAGIQVKVVCLTPYFPSVAGLLHRGVKTYSASPAAHTFGDVEVIYTRWLCYPLGNFWKYAQFCPRFLLNLGFLTARRNLFRIVDQFQPNALLCHHTLINGFVASQLHSARGIPFISVDHLMGDLQVCWMCPRWWKLLQEVASSASCMISVSGRMQTVMRELLPDSKLRLIYNGSSFAPSIQGKPKQTRGLKIVYCGSLNPQKNVERLICSFAEFADGKNNVKLTVIGDGPHRESLAILATELGCSGSVEFTGPLDKAAVQSEMESSDILALVSRHEAFGVVCLEAMACGCAIVISSDAGVTEILTNGKDALFVSPDNPHEIAEAFQLLYSNRELHANIAAAGHELFKTRCRWQHRAIEYARVLAEAIQEG